MIPKHLVIFSRLPQAGRVKTRLARHIGPARAAQFLRHTLAQLLRELSGDPRWHTALALTTPKIPMTRIPLLKQGTGDMGTRLARLVHRMPRGPLVIIGSDAPQVRRHHIASAFKLLGNHTAVFGPATDGGFWLVGLKRRPSCPAPFHNVRWSSAHTLQDTLANLHPNPVAFLETLSDIDTATDYTRYLSCRRGMISTKLQGRNRESS